MALSELKKGDLMTSILSKIIRRSVRFGLMTIACALASGTAGCELMRAAYEPRPRPEVMEPLAAEAMPAPREIVSEDGSLWGQYRNWSIYADTKALRRGDMVLVKVSQQSKGAKGATTQTERKSSIKASIKKLLGFEERILEETASGLDPVGGTTDVLDVTASNEFKGNGSTERKDDLTATMSAFVTDVLSNGNLIIYGHQTVQVNNEASILTVQGVIRPEDIAPDNSIDSDRIANARIEFNGSGIITDKQHPGWGMRAFDWVWPF